MGDKVQQGEVRVLAINIDVDPLRMYRAIHSLPQREEGDEVYTLGVERFLEFCESLGLRATIFAVAEDVKGEVARVLQEATRRGHEVASHSMTHPYGLFKDPTKEEIEGSKKWLEDALGTEVVGFRSPGYNVSRPLLELVALHYSYDSSILPSPPYFLARAAIIGIMRLVGKHSSSFVGHAGQFFRSWRPFAWETSSGRLPEFPMSAVYGFPVIGTTLARGLPRWLLSKLRRRFLINLEFHAIDFLDLSDGLEEELLVEPALKVPLPLRLQRFRDQLEFLIEGAKNLTLKEVLHDVDHVARDRP